MHNRSAASVEVGRNKTSGDNSMDAGELAEWLESLDDVAFRYGPHEVHLLFRTLQDRARRHGIMVPFRATTPYVNTIPVEEQPAYPGDWALERRIRSLIRWNAMAMVVRANRHMDGIGGHISTYSSAATLYEVGFNHFFHAPTEDHPGDFIYFQGHASPGIYARAFLEGRLTKQDMENFRSECPRETGLSSYPHPWLMPTFWQFPTVSMGLGPIQAIYQARFLDYLNNRGIVDTSKSRVWCFVGDGETDEPETLGALTLASREKLDNLIFVVNCNLQRLDGPVRGNGKIIQELEAAFRGAGWNCLKVIWGRDWDPLLADDDEGLLARRMEETLDGQYQKYVVESGSYIRDHFFGDSPELRAMVEHLSDEQLRKLNRGGHDPGKVYAAYKAAVEHQGGRRSFSPRPLRGTAWAKRAKAATSRTSRSSSTRTSCGPSAAGSTCRSKRTTSSRPPFIGRPRTALSSNTCGGSERIWAVICPPAIPPRRSCPSPNSKRSAICSKGAATAPHRPRWPSAAC
jgi:pyruvate dehydrogenase E1 component